MNPSRWPWMGLGPPPPEWSQQHPSSSQSMGLGVLPFQEQQQNTNILQMRGLNNSSYNLWGLPQPQQLQAPLFPSIPADMGWQGSQQLNAQQTLFVANLLSQFQTQHEANQQSDLYLQQLIQQWQSHQQHEQQQQQQSTNEQMATLPISLLQGLLTLTGVTNTNSAAHSMSPHSHRNPPHEQMSHPSIPQGLGPGGLVMYSQQLQQGYGLSDGPAHSHVPLRPPSVQCHEPSQSSSSHAQHQKSEKARRPADSYSNMSPSGYCVSSSNSSTQQGFLEDGEEMSLIFPRQKAGEPFRMSSHPVALTKNRVSELFDKPLKDAADSLGISMTAFRKACRKIGVDRWPYQRVVITKSGSQDEQQQSKASQSSGTPSGQGSPSDNGNNTSSHVEEKSSIPRDRDSMPRDRDSMPPDRDSMPCDQDSMPRDRDSMSRGRKLEREGFEDSRPVKRVKHAGQREREST